MYFLSAYGIHLFADDTDNLIERAQAQWQIRVNTSHLFVDVSGTNEQLGVLGHFVLGRFAASLGEELGLFH